MAAQLEVVKVTIATGAETTLTYPTDYSVSVNNDQDSSPGGSVTLTSSLSSSYKLYVRRAPVFTQETDLTPQGPYNAQTVETQFDQVAAQALDLLDRMKGAPYLGIQKGTGFNGRIRSGVSGKASYVIAVDQAETGFELVENNSTNSLVTVDGGTTARLLATRFRDIGVTPLDFGATGDGVADDTAAIDAANTYAEANSLPLYFPPDYTFTYDGDGLTGSHMVLTGAGMSESIIVIGDGKYLIDDDTEWGSLLVRNLRTVGGAGVIRNRRTDTMVQLAYTIRDCYFRDYTAAAISTNSSDCPYWTIENNIFWGANSTACVGVALKGLSDNTWICNNKFKTNKVHIKLSEGGNNVHIIGNELLRYDSGTARVDIHVVPDVDGTNAGTGLFITGNKHGNENRDASDFNIVYADELSGTYFGDKLPDMSSASTGYIRGHRIEGAFYDTGGTPVSPVIKSMTSNVFGCQIGPIAIGGTPPTYILEFAGTPSALTDSDVTWNTIGPVTCDGADDLTGFAVASSFNTVRVFDPAGIMARLSAATAAATTTPFIKSGTWTPAITFGTAGDLDVVYSTQVGRYKQIGQPGNGYVIANCNLNTSTFTHTTASGNLLITGLPVAAAAATGYLAEGGTRVSGITKAGYTQFTAQVNQNGSTAAIVASGSAVSTLTVTYADMPTGGTVRLDFTVVYDI